VTSTIIAIQKLSFHLLPTVNGLGLKISVPIEGIPSKGVDKLFHKEISFCASTVTSFGEVGNVLFGISLLVKLLKLRRLITYKHS